MNKRINNYLAVALTTYCNHQCFYCKRGGESISKKLQTIPFETLKNIVFNAYNIGIYNFRITGGEPTSVEYFGKLLEYILSFKETKVRINTNGFKILENIDILKMYKERVDIVFSVDSISENINGMHFPKYFSPFIQNLTDELVNAEIPVRYNIVVTKINEEEVKNLVMQAIDKMRVNVKLLDLNRFSEYLWKGHIIYGEKAFDMWKKLYIPMRNFYPFLEKISDNSISEWTTKMIGKGNGIPMSVYFRKQNWIQVKDSSRTPKYSEFCKEKCQYYINGDCTEGVFSLFLSTDLTLHLSGCKNTNIYFNLSKCNDTQMKKYFNELLNLI